MVVTNMYSHSLHTSSSSHFPTAAFRAKQQHARLAVQSGRRIVPGNTGHRDLDPGLENNKTRGSNLVARVASQQDLTSEAEKFIEGIDAEAGSSVGKGGPELEAKAVTLRQQYDALQAQVTILCNLAGHTQG
jgi:hypothetical protein